MAQWPVGQYLKVKGESPCQRAGCSRLPRKPGTRSEEHTSELQSQSNLVCRLLLEKKKQQPELDSQSRRICPDLIEKQQVGTSSHGKSQVKPSTTCLAPSECATPTHKRREHASERI